ncbi:hypothetical protein FN846DRAFT_139757 [Sphaerosporella brunnea]|uniref:Transcription factor RfeG n=1 Tax=Sphaerosporella brunnea TaxID=1250544 RepID=A0A5J5ER98_9PEZI|nr:hypothetical protein FN846DRAFT_139757 [Sphaerosporella brunnea]
MAGSYGYHQQHIDRYEQDRYHAEQPLEYFLDGEGIEHHVIQSDLPRYLGSDAVMRRGKDPVTGRRGYLYSAYRPLTTNMIRSLKADTAKWLAEKKELRHLQRPEPGTYAPSHSPYSSSTSLGVEEQTRVRSLNADGRWPDYYHSRTHRESRATLEPSELDSSFDPSPPAVPPVPVTARQPPAHYDYSAPRPSHEQPQSSSSYVYDTSEYGQPQVYQPNGRRPPQENAAPRYPSGGYPNQPYGVHGYASGEPPLDPPPQQPQAVPPPTPIYNQATQRWEYPPQAHPYATYGRRGD